MTHWLRANTSARPLGVDREAKAIRGVILAEEGPFKSKGRGEFDAKGIKEIVKLARAAPGGLKARFTHPTLSDDGLGKMLGRVRDTQFSAVQRVVRGEPKEVMIARGDLYFNESAFNTPSGDLASYVMDLVEEDSGGDNAGMSLVIEPQEEFRLDKKGRRVVDELTGEELPPIWRPLALHAVDVVDVGDATKSMLAAGLSIDGLPDEVLHKATELLRQQFHGKTRAFVQQHLADWTLRALDCYWPVEDDDEEQETISAETLQRRMELRRRMVG
ncbi:MAG TPA: hypothetical protein VMW24_26065 [Sedimentisphaerales bacterium]|nr:hypothetical protein [Sedimentisphaerales bacterium]